MIPQDPNAPEVLSPDGLYRWDGYQWVPRTQPPAYSVPPPGVSPGGGPNRTTVVLILGLVVLLAAAIVTLMLTRSSGTAVVSPTATATPVPTSTAELTPTPTVFTKPPTVPYADPQAEWSASFAGAPTYTDTTESTATGTVPYRYAEYAAFGTDEFVGLLQLPPGATFSLSGGLNGIASKSGGSVVSSKQGTFQGYSSLDGIIALPGGFIACREVRAGQLVYVMGAAGTSNPPADFAAFAASVKLTPH